MDRKESVKQRKGWFRPVLAGVRGRSASAASSCRPPSAVLGTVLESGLYAGRPGAAPHAQLPSLQARPRRARETAPHRVQRPCTARLRTGGREPCVSRWTQAQRGAVGTIPAREKAAPRGPGRRPGVEKAEVQEQRDWACSLFLRKTPRSSSWGQEDHFRRTLSNRRGTPPYPKGNHPHRGPARGLVSPLLQKLSGLSSPNFHSDATMPASSLPRESASPG